jgi:hypothetical protein
MGSRDSHSNWIKFRGAGHTAAEAADVKINGTLLFFVDPAMDVIVYVLIAVAIYMLFRKSRSHGSQ